MMWTFWLFLASMRRLAAPTNFGYPSFPTLRHIRSECSGIRISPVRLWGIDTRKVIATWTGHTDAVEYICWSDDGRVVSGCHGDGTAKEWDVESGESILGLFKMSNDFTFAFAYSPEKDMIA